jgi:hypothetical protein
VVFHVKQPPKKLPLPPYLRVVLREPIRIVLGQTALEHLLAGHAVGFHIDTVDVKLELDPATKAKLDPPEARELVSTYRIRRPR